MKTLIIAVSMLALTATANATPMQWAANGHWYDVVWVNTGLSWADARDLATRNGGHLATLTSSEEDAFIRDILKGSKKAGTAVRSYWLGGYQEDSSLGPTGQWAWVTGEDWTYQNWRKSKAPWRAGKEDYLHYWNTRDGNWDPTANSGRMGGYVVEYAPQESSALTAPEPTTMLLFGLGLVGLAGFGRRTLNRNRIDE